jgi:RNA polymerase sigma factor (sigma-70 family)
MPITAAVGARGSGRAVAWSGTGGRVAGVYLATKAMTNAGVRRLDRETTVDEAVILAAKGGDAQAFERIMVPLQDRGYRLAQSLLHDPHAAEDAVQEACCKAWQHFDQFRYGSSAAGWFLTIVANQCRSMARTRWWSVERRADPNPDRASHDPVPEATMVLRDELRRLPLDQRLILHLHFCEDLPEEEIAAMLGIARGTVKSRVHRAIARLRRRLGPEAL